MDKFSAFTTSSLLLQLFLVLSWTCLNSIRGHETPDKKNNRMIPADPNSTPNGGEPKELEIFAFGQSAQLGALYDIRSQTFLNTTVFSSPLFNDDLIIAENRDSTYESEGLVEKPSDEFRLLDLNPRQALGILLGQGASIPSRGSTGFLWNVDQHGVDGNGNDETGGIDEQLEGTFKYSIKYLKTAEERLNLKHAHMPFGIDFTKLKESRASHVLIKIQYGVGLTVRIPLSTPRVYNSKAKINIMPSPFRPSSKYSPEIFSDIEDLDGELGRIRAERESNVTFVSEERQDDVDDEEKVETETEGPLYTEKQLKTKTKIRENFKTFSKDDADALIRSFPHHTNGFRKGIPLKYALLSVRDFLKHFVEDDSVELDDIPQPAYPNSQLDYFTLERALSAFDGITLMRRTLAQLDQSADRHLNLLRDDDLRRITITRRHFLKTSNKLKADLRGALTNAPLEDRAGASDLHTNVRTMLENYSRNIYSYSSVNDSLRSVEFRHALEKMKLLDYIKSTGVLYLGRGASVEKLQLVSHSNNNNDRNYIKNRRTYILFFKDLSTVSSKLKWLQTRSLFFNLRFKGSSSSSSSSSGEGGSSLVVVDCNFAWAFEECENVYDKPIIHEYIGATLVSNDYPNNKLDFGASVNQYGNATRVNDIDEKDVAILKNFGKNLIEHFGILKRSGNRAIGELQVFQSEGETRIKTEIRGQLQDLAYSLRSTLYNIQYELNDAEQELEQFLRDFDISSSRTRTLPISGGETKTKSKGIFKKQMDFPVNSRRRTGTRRRQSRSKLEFTSFPSKNADSFVHSQELSRPIKSKRPDVNVNNKNKKEAEQTTCEIIERGISLADQQEIVQRHNALRQFVAAGMERRGNPGPQPPALQMFQLEWDEELAMDAQRSANRCEIQLNKNKIKTSSFREVGQNLKVRGNFYNNTRTNAPVLPPDWTGTIDRWYDQVQHFDSRSVGQFGSSQLNTDAYTQMMWGKTKRIGCGYSQFTAQNDKGQEGVRRLYLCNYGPKGNERGQPVYTIRTRG